MADTGTGVTARGHEATDVIATIRSRSAGRPALVLDDDPTGTQTVRDVVVLTAWDERRLAEVLGTGIRATYLLTNSRSLTEQQAAGLARQLGVTILAATRAQGTIPTVISRSDSTLRGHFPAEVDALADGLGMPEARVLLAPYFGAGGRVTIDGVHYLRRDGRDTPVAETEFAQDRVFGYRSSDLCEWVAERCGEGARSVGLVDLPALHSDGPAAVTRALMQLPPRGVLVVDAVLESDIEMAALGALDAELAGLPLIARTAASYARARAGQPPARPLGDDELERGAPGLVIVGSHVPTTSRQLEVLLADAPTRLATFELRADELLAEAEAADRAIARVAAHCDEAIGGGTTPVVHTSRQLVEGADPEADLGIGATISAGLVDVVRRIERRPAWIIAKGGITSSDVATRGLRLTEARVLGPLLAGVPAWQCGPGSRWPGLTYVVFPGNVGAETALRDAVARLIPAS